MNFKFGRKYIFEYFHGSAGSVGPIGMTGSIGTQGTPGIVPPNSHGFYGDLNQPDIRYLILQSEPSQFIRIMDNLIETHETNF